jgi:hypothetical protein
MKTVKSRRYARIAWARCNDCDWMCDEKNAHGVAVQHHDRTNHWVDVTVEMSYHPRDDTGQIDKITTVK